jgi:hypothetical protein
LELLFYFESYHSRLIQCKSLDERIKLYKEIAANPILVTNQEILMNFATMSLDAFRLASSVIQHLCARIDHTRFNNLADVIEKGVFVLYSYIYYHWAGNNEATIIKNLINTIPNDIEIVPFDTAFERAREEFRETAKNYYHSVDPGAPAIIVGRSEENKTAKTTSAVIKKEKAPTQIFSTSFLKTTTSSLRDSAKNNSPTVPSSLSSSSSSSLNTKESIKMKQKKILTKWLSPESQEQLFPQGEIQPIDPGESYKKLFIAKHGAEAILPQFIIKVPFTQALKIHGKKQSYYMEDGMTFLDYTHMADWMRDKWHASVSNTRRWDLENIAWPWLDTEQKRFADVIPINTYETIPEFIEFMRGFEERQFNGPLRQKMRSEMFTSLIPRDSLESYGDPHAIVPFIYTPVFEHGRILEQRLKVRNSLNRQQTPGTRGPGDLPSENEIFYQPIAENITGDFYKDYGKIMPPCIRAMYETHVRNRTHLKNDERLKFFWWTFKASVPLDLVLSMWEEMIDNDASVPSREKKSLRKEAVIIYQKQQRNREAQNEFKYFGCAKMSTHCPFTKRSSTPSCSSSSDVGDIEDLGKNIGHRKISCGTALWEQRIPVPSPNIGLAARWPGRYLKDWSPMTATALLSEYYLNKL